MFRCLAFVAKVFIIDTSERLGSNDYKLGKGFPLVEVLVWNLYCANPNCLIPILKWYLVQHFDITSRKFHHPSKPRIPGPNIFSCSASTGLVYSVDGIHSQEPFSIFSLVPCKQCFRLQKVSLENAISDGPCANSPG